VASTTPALHRMASVDERSSLRRIPALRSLSPRELGDVQERMIFRSYQAGEVIWRTRGPLQFTGFIQNGDIELEIRAAGALVRKMRLHAGDPLPPRVLQNRRLHEIVIARAVTDVQLGILPALQKRSVAGGAGWKNPSWLLPILLLLLVILLARDDIVRITSGLFYLVARQDEQMALQYPRSMILLEAAQKLDKRAAFASNEAGYRWFQENKLPDASAAFHQAVISDPANAPALNNLAVTYFNQGDLSQAAGTLQQAMQQDPDNPVTSYNLGIARMQLGDPAGALLDFREAGFIDPKAAPPQLQQAYLYQRMGDFVNAEQRARSAIKLNPSSPPAHLLLGMALYNQGREADALASFAEALKLEPGNRVAAFYQALILGHEKKYDAALPVLYELLASSPNAAETARILAEIDALYRFKTEPTSAGP
jgi:tetratricopeptide (TPR) repeat protein